MLIYLLFIFILNNYDFLKYILFGQNCYAKYNEVLGLIPN